MWRKDLPSIRLADLPGGAETVVLCHSARLATDLRRAHGVQQAERGLSSWRALQTATPALWLDHLCSGALLRGEIPPEGVPGIFLTSLQERGLWEQAIRADAKHSAWALELFDINGMAQAALDAAALMQTWRLDVPEAMQTEEYQAFLRWRQSVHSACEKNGWCSKIQALAWRTDCVSRGVNGLPARIGLAGFLSADPALARLLTALEARGVALFRLDFGNANATTVSCREQVDTQAECVAAARWAAALVQEAHGGEKPTPTLVRIAVADLPAQRRNIEQALAAALHPERIGAAWAGHEANFHMLGAATLADQALVDVALSLLQLLVNPRRIAQADFGALLRAPGWSADVTEADGRASLEAHLREVLPPAFGLDQLYRAISRVQDELGITQLFGHLDVLLAATKQIRTAPRRQLSSTWAAQFVDLLNGMGWPGERPLIAAEQAAITALREAMTSLTSLDPLLGRVDAAEALRHLQRQCREQKFQIKRQNAVRVEVCSLPDALAAPVDALWVMGMNESVWPPVARANPLLPADLQRRAGIPSARSASQTEVARETQTHWQRSAAQVVFSWPVREGERELRVSPLLADLIASTASNASDAAHLGAESLAPTATSSFPASSDDLLEHITDARAPALTEAERVRGGTHLLKAQAICPAWGFYQYRLGISVLPAPTGGLDSKARGILLHAALEAFWRVHSQADLLAMDEATCREQVALAVEQALAKYDRQAIEPVPPRLRQLEHSRLLAVILEWLKLEAGREAFLVIACEAHHDLLIDGLPVHVVIDRVDQLHDGRLVVIDYKSGKKVSANSWAQSRISEPQLPIYAALAFPDQPLAAVALARVTVDDPAFIGIADAADVLSKVKALAELRKRYPEHEFADWPSLRQRWAERLTVVAREIKDGCAAVVFDSEKAVAQCEVLPLLRIAERRAQFEAQQLS